MVTLNSLKTRNSLSGEFWVLSYHSFALYILFHDTWNHAWKTAWKVCASAYEAHQVLRKYFKYQGFRNENSNKNGQDNNM